VGKIAEKSSLYECSFDNMALYIEFDNMALYIECRINKNAPLQAVFFSDFFHWVLPSDLQLSSWLTIRDSYIIALTCPKPVGGQSMTPNGSIRSLEMNLGGRTRKYWPLHQVQASFISHPLFFLIFSIIAGNAVGFSVTRVPITPCLCRRPPNPSACVTRAI